MANNISQSRKGLLDHFQNLVDEFGSCEDIELSGSLRLDKKKVRLPATDVPLELVLGGDQGKRLHLYPEVTLDGDSNAHDSDHYILFDPDRFFTSITGFVRISRGESLTLGREDELQSDLLSLPAAVANRHLSLKLPDSGLVLKNKAASGGTCLLPLPSDRKIDRLLNWRMENLQRLVTLLPGPLAPLPKAEALALIERVLEIEEDERLRPLDSRGMPGGLIQLPDNQDLIFIGDMHARIDNLLVILTQNGFLRALEAGTATLMILGDAVHPDEDGMEGSMATSMLMMDIIFRLKLLFPTRVFYLRGNHDSFSEDISKHGVPQGLLWEKALRETRGTKYLRAMAAWYECLPYIALSKNIVTCHAGAPTSKFTRDMLIDLWQQPKLEHELTHIRLQKPNSPSGYNRRDVKRLRKTLDLAPETPFIVGHTPISMDDTLWVNAGDIANHCVLFSSDSDWVGVMTQVDGCLLPLRYPAESLSGLFNQLAEKQLSEVG